MINNALFEFTALYCHDIKLSSSQEARLTELKYYNQILNRNYSNAFDLMVAHYTYKGMYSDVPNPFINEEDEPVLRMLFPIVLEKIVEYFQKEGIDLLLLWCGRFEYSSSLKYVVEIENDLVITKHAFPIEGIDKLYYISIDSSAKQPFQILSQFQREEDSDGTLFLDHSIILYLLNTFLNEYLRSVGKSEVDDRKRELVDRPYRNELRKTVVDAFISESYRETIRRVITAARPKYLPKSSKAYIYCMVKFEGVRRNYSYIADDTTIQVGDYVFAPLGEDNCATIGQVTEVKHCTAGNAPYPPNRTKRIISKLLNDGK